jgi:predicted RNase H-like HicB family nuclease
MEPRQVTYLLAIIEQEGGYLVYFPALPGCNAWGETYKESIRNAGEALAVYLESLEALGKALPEEHQTDDPVSLGITVRVPVIM